MRKVEIFKKMTWKLFYRVTDAFEETFSWLSPKKNGSSEM